MESTEGTPFRFLFLPIDIKEFNKEIDDGLGDLKIAICATHGYGTEGKFESIKKYLCEKYPQCEGNVEWKDFPVPRMVSVCSSEFLSGNSSRLLERLSSISTFWPSC